MKMAFRLDVRSLASGLVRTVRRFPLSVVFCAASAAILIGLAHADEPLSYLNMTRAISLGLPLGFLIALLAESGSLSRSRVLALTGAVLLALLAYYGWMTHSAGQSAIRPFSVEIRHVMFYAIALLSIPLVPFGLRPDARSGLRGWALVYGLARSFVLAVFWGGALFVGISAAFLSISFLFEVSLSEHWYSDTWILLATIFSPIFFLSRVPPVDSVDAVDAKSYPKELRLFAQFVLLPLTAGYFIILYAYAARIAWLGVWPEGQLAYLIMGASTVGMLAYAALYPLREGARWVRRVGDALVGLMVPLSLLLFWTIGIRVLEYGVTENRYLVCAFGVWVFVSSAYLLVSRAKDIRVLPAALCAVVLVSSVGPWGALAVSERSQTNRLANVLWAHGLLVDGTLVDATIEWTPWEREDVESILTYLDRMHGGASLREWYDGPQMDEAGAELSPADAVRRAFRSSADAFDAVGTENESRSRTFRIDALRPVGNVVDTRGLARFAAIDLNAGNPVENPEANTEVDGVAYRWAIGADGASIELYERDARVASFSIEAFLRAHAGTSSDDGFSMVSFDESVAFYSTDRLDALVVFDRVNGTVEDGVVAADRIEASVFFTIK